MAKKKRFYMSTKQILNITPSKMARTSTATLKKMTTILNSAANKRIKRAYKKGLSSAVIDRAMESGKFSVKNLESRTDIENAFLKAKLFLETQTSSSRGIKKAQRNMFRSYAKTVNETLPEGEKINVSDWTKDLTDSDIKNVLDLVWTQVDKLAEDKRLGIGKNERYKLAAHAFNVVTRDKRPIKTKRGLFLNLKKYNEELYTQMVEHENDEMTLTGEEEEIAKMYRDFT